jgi:hypothetical protein
MKTLTKKQAEAKGWVIDCPAWGYWVAAKDVYPMGVISLDRISTLKEVLSIISKIEQE